MFALLLLGLAVCVLMWVALDGLVRRASRRWNRGITTYGVPGVWLAVWVAELQGRRDDEAETILSVEVV